MKRVSTFLSKAKGGAHRSSVQSACVLQQNRSYRSDLVGTNLHERFSLHHDRFYESRVREYTQPMNKAVKVAVTGAAGQIGYSLLFRLASGQMLGPDQPVYINAVELPGAMDVLKGVMMEVSDCAFPLLKGIFGHDDPEKGFEDVDYALLVGSKPRGPGQERGDLLKENGQIFQTIGRALNSHAKKDCRVTVVGNPANTNCMICAHNAPDIPVENFTSMMRLDHDRGLSQAARKAGCHASELKKFAVWGNHSPTMFPDLTYTETPSGPISKVADFDKWYSGDFIPTVQQRGAAIIDARGLSSAASAANAAIAQTRDWAGGSNGEWTTMGVVSNGEYGVPKGLWSGFPMTMDGDGTYSIVSDLKLSPFQEERIKKSVAELTSERNSVASLLK
eukprot:225217_1